MNAEQPRVTVVVAHPDDETFGCGSILLHAAAAGARTTVVCATRGEAGGVAAGVHVPTGGIAALREDELHSAARALGVDGGGAARVHGLGDGRLPGGRLPLRGAVRRGGDGRPQRRRAARP